MCREEKDQGVENAKEILARTIPELKEALKELPADKIIVLNLSIKINTGHNGILVEPGGTYKHNDRY